MVGAQTNPLSYCAPHYSEICFRHQLHVISKKYDFTASRIAERSKTHSSKLQKALLIRVIPGAEKAFRTEHKIKAQKRKKLRVRVRQYRAGALV